MTGVRDDGGILAWRMVKCSQWWWWPTTWRRRVFCGDTGVVWWWRWWWWWTLLMTDTVWWPDIVMTWWRDIRRWWPVVVVTTNLSNGNYQYDNNLMPWAFDHQCWWPAIRGGDDVRDITGDCSDERWLPLLMTVIQALTIFPRWRHSCWPFCCGVLMMMMIDRWWRWWWRDIVVYSWYGDDLAVTVCYSAWNWRLAPVLLRPSWQWPVRRGTYAGSVRYLEPWRDIRYSRPTWRWWWWGVTAAGADKWWTIVTDDGWRKWYSVNDSDYLMMFNDAAAHSVMLSQWRPSNPSQKQPLYGIIHYLILWWACICNDEVMTADLVFIPADDDWPVMMTMTAFDIRWLVIVQKAYLRNGNGIKWPCGIDVFVLQLYLAP